MSCDGKDFFRNPVILKEHSLLSFGEGDLSLPACAGRRSEERTGSVRIE